MIYLNRNRPRNDKKKEIKHKLHRRDTMYNRITISGAEKEE